MYNICYSEKNRLLKRSKTLREYSMFIYFVNEYLDREMSLEEAVAEAVKRAKSKGILVDFLNKYATGRRYAYRNNSREIRIGYEERGLWQSGRSCRG